ncbi:MAG: putative serine protease [Chloroflexi bacterium]|nr:putative serine protease [Chloroflexota bacterium]
MLRRWRVSVLALCLAPLAISLPSVAGGSALGTGRYVVVLKSSAVASDVAGTATGLGGTIDHLFGTVDTLVVSLPRLHLGILQHDPRVAYVTPDLPVQLLAGRTPAALPAVPTGVARIGAAPALNPDGTIAVATSPARKAAVALLDTGIMNRPDLNVVGGYDCSSSSGGSTADTNGHGTHVAGIVADKGIPGVIGVSPGTPLYAVRVFDANGSGSTSAVICGLDWVAKNAAADNIKVVNMSLGGEGSDDGNCGNTDQDPLHTVVCRVTGAGVTVVAAAGNDGADMANSAPAAYAEVLAVTAMADFDGKPGGLVSSSPCDGREQDDTAASFSDYAVPGSADANHTIAGPGVCITSTWNDGGTQTISGTSMASPHVAGLVARCIDAGPCAGLAPARIIAKLRADAAARPADQGFLGDTSHPVAGKYYGNLADDTGY